MALRATKSDRTGKVAISDHQDSTNHDESSGIFIYSKALYPSSVDISQSSEKRKMCAKAQGQSDTNEHLFFA